MLSRSGCLFALGKFPGKEGQFVERKERYNPALKEGAEAEHIRVKKRGMHHCCLSARSGIRQIFKKNCSVSSQSMKLLDKEYFPLLNFCLGKYGR